MENKIGLVSGQSGELHVQVSRRMRAGDEEQSCPACEFHDVRGGYWFPSDLRDAALNLHGGSHPAHEYDAILVAMDEFTAAAAEKYDEFVAEWARRRERVLEWRGMTSSLHPAPKAAS